MIKDYSEILQKIPEEVKKLFCEIKIIVFDFDGVFTDNSVYVDERGRETVKCSRYDGVGLKKLDKLGIKKLIISSEINKVVIERSKKLQIQCLNGIEEKNKELIKILKEFKIDPSQAAFVGNDINDANCLETVGLPIVVSNCHPEVRKKGKYVTKYLGGYGAVREVCDIIEKLRN